MALADQLILFWALPSLILMLLGLQYAKSSPQYSEIMTFDELMGLIICSVVLPLGLVGVIFVLYDERESITTWLCKERKVL